MPSDRGASRSLTSRLVVSFLALSLATVGIVAAVAFYRARNALREEIANRLAASAASREREVLRWVGERQADLALLAGLPPFRTATAGADADPAIGTLLTLARQTTPSLHEVILLSVPGARVLASSDPSRVGRYHVTDTYFREGQKGPFVQDVYPSPETGLPALTIATPIGVPGEASGVLAAHLDLATLDRIIADSAGLGAGGEAYLLDRFGDFVTAQRFGRDRFPRGVSSLGITRAISERANGTGTYRNYAGVPVIGAYRWLADRQLAILVEQPQAIAFAPARALATSIVAVGLTVAALLAALILSMARQIAGPVRAVTEAAERVAAGDLAATAPVTGRDEVGRLARAFNAMTGRLQELYSAQDRQVAALGRAAADLVESQQLLQTIVDNTPAYLSVSDVDGRVLMLNAAAARVFGIDRDAAVGRNLKDIVRPENYESGLAERQAVLRSGTARGREETRVIDGEVRNWYLLRFPLRNAVGEVYAVCVLGTDITDVKRAEAERQSFAEQIQHTQKLESLGVLAGGIAHDFNNLLTAMLGHAHLALAELPGADPVREDIERIAEAARRATEMTNQMLAYAGRGRFVVEPVDLNGLVTRMSQLLQVSMSKKVELRYALTSGLPAISADPVQMQQVVMNLITNAAEAIGDRVGIIRLSTTVVDVDDRSADPAVPGPGRYVSLEVVDDGAGMDEATRARIFEPFFTTKFTGRGLGLAAVLGIVRGHDGAITVDSAPGRGTRFRVLFPALASAVAEPAVRTAPAVEPGRGTVLVVDDEEPVRRLAERCLRRSGYRVVTAENGAVAVDLFRRQPGDVVAVLLDLTMPEMDGRQALAELRRLDPGVRVVLASGYSDQDLVLGGVEDVAFLQKPYTPADLLARIGEVATAIP